MTWLNMAFSRRASGVVVLSGCRKTAVPGTWVTGSLCSQSMNGASGPSMAVRRSVTRVRPRCQVSITVATTSAMSSGSQPPWATLVRLAAK